MFAMPSVMLRQHGADHRPAGRHALLQPGRGRRRAAVAAPVLVLRPPRGLLDLHPRRSASCRRSSRPSRAGRCSATRRWCCRSSRPRFLVVRAVGAPHVRDQRARARQELLHRGEHDDRDPDRRCRSSAGSRRCGPAGSILQDAAAVRARLLLHPRPRRHDRAHARLGAARPAGARHLLRRRAPALRADRRRGVPALRRASTTGSRSSPAG